MKPQGDGIYPEWAHVDRNVEELAEETPDTKQLAGKISGTSQETARLFGGGGAPLKPYEGSLPVGSKAG
jgi:hypothetical protein